MVDARLPDGSRVNAVIPPLAIDGSALTIRKFSADPLTAKDLISFGTLSQQACDFLSACVRGRLNIIVSGSTGAGKTTTLNVLSSFIPADERIVTIEDAAELQLHQDTSSASSPARPTSRARVRSTSATWCATHCACAPTASSSVRCATPPRSTCCRR